MVLRNEALLAQLLPYNQFGLHAVGAGLRHGEVFGLAVKGIAIAVDIERSLSGEDVSPALLHALQEPFQLRIVAAVGGIEHIPVRHEAEGVDRISLLLPSPAPSRAAAGIRRRRRPLWISLYCSYIHVWFVHVSVGNAPGEGMEKPGDTWRSAVLAPDVSPGRPVFRAVVCSLRPKGGSYPPPMAEPDRYVQSILHGSVPFLSCSALRG